MNEFEVAKLPNGIDGVLSGIKPATPIKWNSEHGVYEKDTSSEVLEKYSSGCELVKESLREVYSFGEKISRGTPKFCLSLKQIYDNLKYIEDDDVKNVGYGYQSYLNVRPAMDEYGRGGSNFIKLVSKLGLSETAAYRYKDLGIFVDPETAEYYKEFQGYSLSLLSEIWTYSKSNYCFYITDLKKLTEVVPVDTTIEDFRLYSKVMKLKSGWKEPFDKRENREKIKGGMTVSKVLKVYNELLQKQEEKKLNDVLTTSNTTEKKNVVTLVDSPEIQTLRKELDELRPKAQRAALVGVCANCKHKDVNLNKCRCCRRYENLKDLFESK